MVLNQKESLMSQAQRIVAALVRVTKAREELARAEKEWNDLTNVRISGR